MVRLALFAIVLAASSPLAVVAQDPSYIEIESGAIAGVYYPIASSICNGINSSRSEHGIRCAVEATSGSLENLQRVEAGGPRLGFVQDDLLNASTDPLAGNGRVRIIGRFQREILHVIVRADSGILAFEDLRRHKFTAGQAGSGSGVVADAVFTALGWQIGRDIFGVEVSPSEQARALCDGSVDVVFWMAAIPSQSVVDAAGGCQIRLIGLSPSIQAALETSNSALHASTIDRGAYSGVDKDVDTIATTSVLIANDELPDRVRQEVTKYLSENIDGLRHLHPSLLGLTRALVLP